MKNYLNFETEVKNLEAELDQLKDPYNQEGLSEVDTSKISKVQKEIDEKLSEIYSNLDPWQTALVARHEDRPKLNFSLIICSRSWCLFLAIDIMEKTNLSFQDLLNLMGSHY